MSRYFDVPTKRQKITFSLIHCLFQSAVDTVFLLCFIQFAGLNRIFTNGNISLIDFWSLYNLTSTSGVRSPISTCANLAFLYMSSPWIWASLVLNFSVFLWIWTICASSCFATLPFLYAFRNIVIYFLAPYFAALLKFCTPSCTSPESYDLFPGNKLASTVPKVAIFQNNTVTSFCLSAHGHDDEPCSDMRCHC